jgi:hypothetical protein
MARSLKQELEKIQDKAQSEQFNVFYRKNLKSYFKRLHKVIDGVTQRHEYLLKIQNQAESNERELFLARKIIKEHGLEGEFEKRKV